MDAIGNLFSINLDEELKTLRRNWDHLSAQESDKLTEVENAEIQLRKRRRSVVENWFRNVKLKKTKFQEIENEYRKQGVTRKLKSCIEKEIKVVEELIQQGKFPDGVVLDDHASSRLPLVTTNVMGQSAKENFESICKWVKEDEVFAIGVHGM